MSWSTPSARAGETLVARRGSARRPKARRGVATLLALAVAAAVSLAAIATLDRSHEAGRRARADLAALRASLAVDAALVEAAAAVVRQAAGVEDPAGAPSVAQLFSDDGWSWRIGAFTVRARVRDAAGLLDADAVDAQRLADAAARASGADAAAVARWRARIDAARSTGPIDHIDALIAAASTATSPSGTGPTETRPTETGPTESGRAEAGLREVATAWNGAPTIDPSTAPAAVLATTPGLGADDVAAALRLRADLSMRDPLFQATSIIDAAPAAARPWLAAGRSGVLIVRVSARSPSGAGAEAHRVLRVAAPTTPGGVVWWIDHAEPSSRMSTAFHQAGPQ